MKALRLPILLFAVPAALVALLPGAPALLVLDRAALASGEWWRLWTGHWVHFSSSHLGWNLAVLLAAGSLLERTRPDRLLRFTLLAAPLISAAVLIGEPQLAAYGGLSGLATGTVTLLALTELERSSRDPIWWIGFLLLVAVKSGFDAVSHRSMFSHLATGIQVSSTAHLAGLCAAVAFCLSPCAIQGARRSPQPKEDRPSIA